MPLISERQNTINCILNNQVDGTLYAFTSSLSTKEVVVSKVFPDEGQISVMETAVVFNGNDFSKAAGVNQIIINQRHYIKH